MSSTACLGLGVALRSVWAAALQRVVGVGGPPVQDMLSARPVEERVEGAFPALVSQAPPCLLLTLPLLWEILSRSPSNRKGCQSGGLHPLTSLDRDVLRGQQGPDSGRDPSPALGS